MKPTIRSVRALAILAVGALALPGATPAAEPARPLHAGWATVDITPQKPVNLVGQRRKRIARTTRDPLTATALALETRGADGPAEQAILVSCDVISSPKEAMAKLREALKPLVPDFDIRKLILNATHTHTAPGLVETNYKPYDVSGDAGVMKPTAYAAFFAERVAGAAAEAWKSRKPAGMAWGLGYAAVGTNRRAVYFNGRSVMYGKTRDADFSHIEGGNDDAVELLYFWDADRTLTGIVVNIACPSQETEGLSVVSADFWHETREAIRERLGKGVFVLPQCGAGGDQSPHPIFRKRAEAVMQKRRGLTRRQELARRIASAVADVLPAAKTDVKTSIVFRHDVAEVDLPEKDPPAPPFVMPNPVRPVEFHVLRLGDVAMATNPFELYLDYGIRMKARSPAVLTFVVQLSCQYCGYLPTALGVKGGGYSAEQYLAGPKGGKVLVDETVKRIEAFWK
jgi:hypothetical protein